jgi:cytosine/adenosine deaminase-related metal-dependent hydrolase
VRGGALGLAPGAMLDVVTLAADHPALVGRSGDEILDSWIFAGDRGLIDCVWRAGVKLVSAGRHRDRAALEPRYARALRTLLA